VGRLRAARAALRRGGVGELNRSGRRWAARKVYPGDFPSSQQAAREAPKSARKKPRATDVGFAAATRFFDQRRATYNALADAIAPYLDPNGTLLDVGGNIGYFTRVVGERTGFRGSVHLFEPLPHLSSFISRTLADVPYSVTVHQYGLSDQDGEVEIYIAADGNLGWNTLIREQTQDGMQPIPVKLRRYDDIGLSVTPSLVKIDVEGAEYLVLRGLLPSIAQWSTRPPILCEIGWGADGHPAWEEELAVFDALAELGYRAHDIIGEPIEVPKIDKTTDVLFLPA
jgi:FkbM family methyltransferase